MSGRADELELLLDLRSELHEPDDLELLQRLVAPGDRQQRGGEVFAWLHPRAGRASGVTLREAVKYLAPEQRDALLRAAGRPGTTPAARPGRQPRSDR